jgi:hypothetical protein
MHLKSRLPDVSDTWWLITITANEWRRSEASSLENIRLKLESLYKRLKRIYTHIEYVRVYEKHPTSEAIHAHLIMAGLSPFLNRLLLKNGEQQFKAIWQREKRNGTWTIKTWFKKTARELKMGYMIDVQLIKDAPEKCVWYVTKYLTKDQQSLHIKGLRHVQVTRGIGSPETTEDHVWQVGQYITSRTFAPGTKVTDLNTGFIVDNNYWEEKSLYPWD